MRSKFYMPCELLPDKRIIRHQGESICDGCKNFLRCVNAGKTIKGFTFCGVRVAVKNEMRYYEKLVIKESGMKNNNYEI